ncbi:hypothetical protein [Acinetobacter brisouii]|uniref:hypothetical protein n=1 Tax=Acinetobacter brisouii TaxID=396323 RepID=UPI001C068EF3|nr:hypothetical protein [Acinetobacter brisouii]
MNFLNLQVTQAELLSGLISVSQEVERDFSNWDETIFERCLRDGFNVFGSGPTPILLRPEKETEPAPDTRSLGNDSHD